MGVAASTRYDDRSLLEQHLEQAMAATEATSSVTFTSTRSGGGVAASMTTTTTPTATGVVASSPSKGSANNVAGHTQAPHHKDDDDRSNQRKKDKSDTEQAMTTSQQQQQQQHKGATHKVAVRNASSASAGRLHGQRNGLVDDKDGGNGAAVALAPAATVAFAPESAPAPATTSKADRPASSRSKHTGNEKAGGTLRRVNSVKDGKMEGSGEIRVVLTERLLTRYTQYDRESGSGASSKAARLQGWIAQAAESKAKTVDVLKLHAAAMAALHPDKASVSTRVHVAAR